MSNYIYKYIGPNYLDKVFTANDHVTLKCSCPKDFNDPYELFLTIDFNERPEVLAFYVDAVGDLPQLPTTCFSHSPAVIPMWAHYAQSLQGLCIEFNEQMLSKTFPKSGFGDVDYADEPDPGLTQILYRAYEIGKFRYMHFLHKSIFSAAYYTKALFWSYEQERRMIVGESETRKADELILMDVPHNCITSLICGPRASEEIVSFVQEKADNIGCRYLQMKIGKTSLVPFFVDHNGGSFTYNGTDIERSDQFCNTCKEPISNSSKQCSWCQIDESHRINAASRNPYRILDRYGLLESYIKGAIAIDKGEGDGKV